jgi:DNA polymerase-3 subunit gamma/tau
VLVRIAYAADLPTPDEVIRLLGEGSGAPSSSAARPSGNGGIAASSSAPAVTAVPVPRPDAPRASLARSSGATAPVALARAAEPQPAAPAVPTIAVGRFEELLALAEARRDLPMKSALERDVRLVRFEDGKLEIALEPGAAKTLVNDLSRKLAEWTGRRWLVVVSAEAGAPTVRSQLQAREAELKAGVRGDPLVQAVLARFPGAEIVGVRRRGAADEPAGIAGVDQGMPAPGEDDVPFDPGDPVDD